MHEPFVYNACTLFGKQCFATNPSCTFFFICYACTAFPRSRKMKTKTDNHPLHLYTLQYYIMMTYITAILSIITYNVVMLYSNIKQMQIMCALPAIPVWVDSCPQSSTTWPRRPPGNRWACSTCGANKCPGTWATRTCSLVWWSSAARGCGTCVTGREWL